MAINLKNKALAFGAGVAIMLSSCGGGSGGGNGGGGNGGGFRSPYGNGGRSYDNNY